MRADDLRAVLDAVGSDRAVVMGGADGGALAAFFAATHPERVQALILNAAYARSAWAPDYPIGMKEEGFLAEREDMEKGWGTIEQAQEWVDLQAPSLSQDTEYVEWFAKWMRHGASPAPRSNSWTCGSRSMFDRSSEACRRRRSSSPSPAHQSKHRPESHGWWTVPHRADPRSEVRRASGS